MIQYEHKTSLWRNDDEVNIVVHAEASFNKGTPGTLSDPEGWEVDLIRVEFEDGTPVVLTRKEEESLRQEIADRAHEETLR